jgi:hypothetical protein
MATFIVSGVSSTSVSTNTFTTISSTAGVVGSYSPINAAYKQGSYLGVDFQIAYKTTTPTAAQQAFAATGSIGGIYAAQLVPAGAANSYTVCWPQYVQEGDATTANRVMASVLASDGTNFTNNDYLSLAIQGYTPTIGTVAQFVATMKNIGIPVFNNSGTLQ